MAADPIWKTYAVRPTGFGGIAVVASWAVPDPTDSILALAVKVGDASAPTITDPASKRLDLEPEANAFSVFDGLVQGLQVFSFFAQTTLLGWVKGPEITVDLVDSIEVDFPDLKPWIVDNLQASEAATQPLGPSKKVEVRGAYPRDQHGRPGISVMFSASPSGEKLVGELRERLGSFNASGQVLQLGRLWTLTFQMVLWCDTPELRDKLAPWFMNALQRLVLVSSYKGLNEPVFSCDENEDFSGSVAETPLYIVQAVLSGQAWSSLKVPTKNWIGHITI